MIGKLLALLSLLAGAGAGIAAGLFLAEPQPQDPAAEPDPAEAHGKANGEAHGEAGTEAEFVKLKNQFVVPLVKNDKIAALVVLTLGLEVDPGSSETVFQREPKIRDGFLRVLFDQAAMGIFDGTFTQVERLDSLRAALLDEGRKLLGPLVRQVLITDIARQDM